MTMKMKTMMMVVATLIGVMVSPASCGRGYSFLPTSNNRCRVETEYCTFWQEKFCCGGLYCAGEGIGGTCQPIPGCGQPGEHCALFTPCCYPYHCTKDSDGTCVLGATTNDDIISDKPMLSF